LKALCLVAKAIIEFNKGHYKESLSHLKEIISKNPKSPSDIWYAMALCYHRLGNYPKAKIGFQKTLEIESAHSMALVSLGIVEITLNVNDLETR